MRRLPALLLLLAPPAWAQGPDAAPVAPRAALARPADLTRSPVLPAPAAVVPSLSRPGAIGRPGPAMAVLALSRPGGITPPAAVPGPAATTPTPIARCRAAIATAEREAGIPPGLLGAIGRVESGRTDPATGEAGPWPWTVNVEGAGRFFPTAAEAIAHIRQARAGGARSMDIGCMQINLHHHPDAFPTLEDGFDPLTNARYAARFLRQLHAERGDWMAAAGNYHSRTPERAEAYRNAVASRLPDEQARAGAAPGWNPAWPRVAVAPPSAFAATGTPSFGSIRGAAAPVIMRSGAAGGMTRRDLDSYRGMAIPLAARVPAARGGPIGG